MTTTRTLHASDELAELGAHISDVLRKPAVLALRGYVQFSHGADAVLLEIGGMRAFALAKEEGHVEDLADAAHAATDGDTVRVRVYRVDPATAERFRDAMSAPAPARAPAVRLDVEGKALLRQLWPGQPIHSRDSCISSAARAPLFVAGLVANTDGWLSITEKGRAVGRELGWPDPAELDRAREALASVGRAHVHEVKHGPSPAVAPLDMPLTIAEEAARLAAVTGPCDGASFLALGRALSIRMGQPLTERTARAVAGVREALELAHDRLARGCPA